MGGDDHDATRPIATLSFFVLKRKGKNDQPSSALAVYLHSCKNIALLLLGQGYVCGPGLICLNIG